MGRENSLQHLGQIYPNSSNKQLFEHCQKGCVLLLEETYKEFDRINNRNRNNVDDNVSDTDKDNGNKGNNVKKQRKESKICKQMMLCFCEIFRKHIKTTINYASLQQAHNGVVKDFKVLQKDIEEYENDDSNTLNDDALIMASMTASLF